MDVWLGSINSWDRDRMNEGKLLVVSSPLLRALQRQRVKDEPAGAQPTAPIVRIWQAIGALRLTEITALWGPSSPLNSFIGNYLQEQRPRASSCSCARVPRACSPQDHRVSPGCWDVGHCGCCGTAGGLRVVGALCWLLCWSCLCF